MELKEGMKLVWPTFHLEMRVYLHGVLSWTVKSRAILTIWLSNQLQILLHSAVSAYCIF